MELKVNLYWVKDSVSINTTFNETNNKYQLTVGNVPEEGALALESKYGIKVKEGKEGQGNVLTAKSKFPFIFKDMAGNPIDPSTIRNDSEALITVTGSYDHAFAKKYGKGASVFKEVVVTNLVKREEEAF